MLILILCAGMLEFESRKDLVAIFGALVRLVQFTFLEVHNVPAACGRIVRAPL